MDGCDWHLDNSLLHWCDFGSGSDQRLHNKWAGIDHQFELQRLFGGRQLFKLRRQRFGAERADRNRIIYYR